MFIYGRQGPAKLWGKGERAKLGPATPLGGVGEAEDADADTASYDCGYADTDGLRGLDTSYDPAGLVHRRASAAKTRAFKEMMSDLNAETAARERVRAQNLARGKNLGGLTPNECTGVSVADLRGLGEDAPKSALSTLATVLVVVGGLYWLTHMTVKQTAHAR